MPELPEVETVANGVHARIHGQTIRSVWTSNKPQTFKSPPEVIAETLTGARVDRVHRVGKTVALDLTRKNGRREEPAQFLVHLGMTGRLLVSAPETSASSAYSCDPDAERWAGTAVCRRAAVRAAVRGGPTLHGAGAGAVDDFA